MYIYNEVLINKKDIKLDLYKTILIKQSYYNINFIDENDVFVGFEFLHHFKEDFGFYISNEKFSNPSLSLPINEIEGYFFNCLENVDEYNFLNEIIEFKDGLACISLINKDDNIIYLHLYNEHNGYYAHDILINKKDEFLNYSI